MVEIIVAYIKGIMHAIVIPYLLLWLFDDYGAYALAISAIYVVSVGTLYAVADREKFKLSRKAFVNVLSFLIGTAAIFSLIVLLGTLQQ